MDVNNRHEPGRYTINNLTTYKEINMRIFLWIFALFALMTCEKEPSTIATDPSIIATDPPRISAVAEEIVLSRGRRAPEPLIFPITIPEGLASLAMTPVGGISGIISRPTNGALSGQVKATFIAGDEVGEASLTLIVVDQADQMTSETASIEIVETDPPHVIAPQGAILSIERSLRLSFTITTPGGFDSADIKDTSGGIAEIVSHPGIDALSGVVEVDFIAGEEAGDGSITLRINERTSQWISETASIEIVAVDLPSIIAPARVGMLKGSVANLDFTVTTPGGFGSAEIKNVEGGIPVIASEPKNGALSGVVEVSFRDSIDINGGEVTLMIRDNTGQEAEANVEMHIAEPPSVITRGILFPFVAGKTNTLQFTVNTSGGYAWTTVSDVDLGTAWVSSEPENGYFSGVVEVTFVAGPVEGTEEFTIAVRDSLGLSGELSVLNNISLIRGVPLIPLITAPEALVITLPDEEEGLPPEDAIIDLEDILLRPSSFFRRTVMSPGSSETLVAIVSIPNGYASARISSHIGGMAKITSEPEPGASFGRVEVTFTVGEDEREKRTGGFTLEVIDKLGEVADASADIYIIAPSITVPVDIDVIKENRRFIPFSISSPNGFASASVGESVGGTAEIVSMPERGAFDSAITVAFTAGSTPGGGGFNVMTTDQAGISISERVNVAIIGPKPLSVSSIGVDPEILINRGGNFYFQIDASSYGYHSFTLSSNVGGTVRITDEPRKGQKTARLEVRFTAGNEVGEGSFTLTVRDLSGQYTEVVKKFEIISPPPPSPIWIRGPVGPISVAIGRTVTLDYLYTPARSSATLSNIVGGTASMTSKSPGEARVTFTAGPVVGRGHFTLTIRDQMGREISKNVEVDIVGLHPVITFGENLAVVKDSYDIFTYELHIPEGLSSREITNVVGGMATLDAQNKVRFDAGNEVGEGSFTLTVIDRIGQSATEVVNVSIVETSLIRLTFFDSKKLDSNLRRKDNLLSGNTASFSFGFFIPDGYASYEITAVGGEVEVITTPHKNSIGRALDAGSFVISFTAGDEVGEGSFTLTVIDQSGQSKTITARIPIISDILPLSIIPRQEKFFIDPHIGATARFDFDIIAPNGYKSLLISTSASTSGINFIELEGGITRGSSSGISGIEIRNTAGRPEGRFDITITLVDTALQEKEISVPLIVLSAPKVSSTLPSGDLVVVKGEDRTFPFLARSIPDGYASAVVSGEVGGTARISSEPPIGATKGNIEVTFSAASATGDGRFTLTVSGSEGREKKLDLNFEIVKAGLVITKVFDRVAHGAKENQYQVLSVDKKEGVSGIFKFLALAGLDSAKVESVNGTAWINYEGGSPSRLGEIRGTGENRGTIRVAFMGESEGIGSYTLTIRDFAGNQTSISEAFNIESNIPVISPPRVTTVHLRGSQEIIFDTHSPAGFGSVDIEEVHGGMAEIISRPNPGDTRGQVTVLFNAGSQPGNGSIVLRVRNQNDEVIGKAEARIGIPPFIPNIKTKSIHPYENLVIEIQGEIDLGFGDLLIRKPDSSDFEPIASGDTRYSFPAMAISKDYIHKTFLNGKTTITILAQAYHYPPSANPRFFDVIFSPDYDKVLNISPYPVFHFILRRRAVLELWSDEYIEDYRGVIGTFTVKNSGGPFDLTPTFDTDQVKRLRHLAFENNSANIITTTNNKVDKGKLFYDEVLSGHAHIGLNNISADGSSAIIGLMDTIIDTESPVYRFLSKDFYGINKAQTRWYYEGGEREGTHGELMALAMLTIAPRVQIYNLSYHNGRDPYNALELFRSPPRDEILKEVDIINSSGDFIVKGFNRQQQKAFLNLDKIIVVALGNDTDQENGIEDKASRITLPYDFSIRTGAVIIAQAVRQSPEFETHDTAQAGDCKSYTLTVPIEPLGGTSTAAAQLSAILALMIDINFEESLGYTRRELVEILIETADDIGEPGVDRIFGQGLVDVDEAVEFMRTRVKPTHRLYSELE